MNPDIQAKDKANLEKLLESRKKYEQHWKNLRERKRLKIIEASRYQKEIENFDAMMDYAIWKDK